MSLVVLAMSGGVDSSVAAHLLRESGHEVVGVFMRHGVAVAASCATPAHFPSLQVTDHPFHKQGCCTTSDAEDARRVADRLGIDFYALNLQQDFDRVMDYFAEEYASGRTPNPCVMCNHWIKFGRLYQYADSIGAQFVATGHYARLAATQDRMQLYRGRDRAKDQSYVLFGISPALLTRMLLPVGDYAKAEIRVLAAHLGLDVADKRDSQEICFVSPGQHAEFVAARRGGPTGEGEIVTVAGRVVGRHPGIERFTIGQRKGLGVALGEPFYVVHIDAQSRRVTIGRQADLARRELTASRANWLAPIADDWQPCAAQIRYNSAPVPARFRPLSPQRFAVEFAVPCQGVAPGQAVVCYDEDRVIGGGWID
jgi:tRNA-specific 2-thiouridylase